MSPDDKHEEDPRGAEGEEYPADQPKRSANPGGEQHGGGEGGEESPGTAGGQDSGPAGATGNPDAAGGEDSD
jgi:hypothetical protein